MAAESMTVGENVAYRVDGDTLTITIDLKHRNDLGKDPKTGEARKTIRVATTSGNKEMGGVVVGVNAYVYRNPR